VPTFQVSESIAANVTVNVLADRRIANLPPNAHSRVMLAHTGSAVGLEGTCFIGDRNPLEASAISIANRMPILPDDIVFQNEPGLRGEKIVLNIQNTTGGALVYRGTVITKAVRPRRR